MRQVFVPVFMKEGGMLNAVNVRFSYRKLSSLVIGSRLMVFAWYQARWRQFPLGPYPLVCESY